MTLLPNYHILIIKVIGPTDHEPARVKIISERFKQSIKIPFTNHPGASNPATDSAIEYLEKRGHKLIGKGEGKDHMYIISDTFEPLKGK
jgi:hypothetical protein